MSYGREDRNTEREEEREREKEDRGHSGGGRRRRPAELLKGVDRIDYKNVELLERFLETGGRLRSRRRTRTAARDQRKVTQAVKRARHMALLPFTAEHERATRRGGRRRD
jgi:small subunit ribosomal protein S18